MRILVVEDDPHTASYLIRALRESGHVADGAVDGATGLAMAREGIYDALVLDRLLPAMGGVQVLRALRCEGNEVAVLMLSASASTQQRVEGLQAGADDYVSKPFAIAEVLARLDGVLARSEPSRQGQVLRLADLVLHLPTREAIRGAARITLNTREFLLLERLMRSPQQVVTRSMLLESAWDYEFEPPDKLIDKHMHRLRQKIDAGSARPLIHTVRGVGYRIGLAGQSP